MYATKIHAEEDLIKESVATFDPKSALQTDAMAGLDQAMDSAVKLKFLDAPLTKEQLAEFIQIPPRAK
jgi:NitT/TauT family transport system substrate-binding protein